MPAFQIPGCTDFSVQYDSTEDGGGTWFGQEYVAVIQSRYRQRFWRCLKWCSGPGFIGFALLARGLCDELVLIDRHEPAMQSVRDTIEHNHCQDRVRLYHADQISQIPGSERFDIVVANPPHYLECPGDENYQRIAVDIEWQAHQEFYANIARYMAPDGVILLQENQAGSIQGPVTWRDMIDRGGLELTGYFTSPGFYDTNGPTQIYYIESRLAKNLPEIVDSAK